LLIISTLLIVGCANLNHQSRSISSIDSGMEYVEVCDQQNVCRKFSRLIMGTDHLSQSDWTGAGEKGMSDDEVQEVVDTINKKLKEKK